MILPEDKGALLPIIPRRDRRPMMSAGWMTKESRFGSAEDVMFGVLKKWCHGDANMTNELLGLCDVVARLERLAEVRMPATEKRTTPAKRKAK